jgi:hypothetical protein
MRREARGVRGKALGLLLQSFHFFSLSSCNEGLKTAWEVVYKRRGGGEKGGQGTSGLNGNGELLVEGIPTSQLFRGDT